jgi:hypothetical protein
MVSVGAVRYIAKSENRRLEAEIFRHKQEEES